ncbi:hypothetical protein L828_2722 [Mycobacteroides abscessus MAB_030201_1061]|nr:hypothetical protein L828_2722 [Mycobacteroides abscessus MAB_030201_1061]
MDSDVTDIRWMWKGRDSFSNPQAIVGLGQQQSTVLCTTGSCGGCDV